ncbi:MAG TPA: MBL fold metallo-hydrolase [Chthoniobacterales bacterium]|nr:MBL fold metallo-hydrolase [Chthoniobacterales bacterium]
MIACDCPVCRSDDPRNNRMRASIYVETPEAAWVVDTGADFRTQALRANIRRLDAAIFTHSHTDHIMGFDDLRRFSSFRGSMPVYAPERTMQDLQRVFRFAFEEPGRYPWYLTPEPHIVNGPFELGATTIMPLPVPHGDDIVYGYLFSRNGAKLVAYLSDCSALPDETAKIIAGVEVLIIDALRHKPHPTHLSVDEAIEAASRVQPGRTYFTHIAHELPHSAEADLPPNTFIAYDGLKLAL